MPRRPNRLLRALRWGLRASPLCLSLALALWALSTNPFTRPFVQATPAQVEAALSRAMARHATPQWLSAELDAALDAEDADRVDTLSLIAEDRDILVSPEQALRIDALRARTHGMLATAKTCGLCMADIATCPSLRLMAACAIPFELTPGGDLNALRRAGQDALAGDPVDRLDVSLALVGLGATTAVLVSGGTSLTVKVGATSLRVARRLGTLTPEFLRVLTRMADVDLKPARLWAHAMGRAPLDEVADSAKLARLGAVGADVTRIAANTSATDAVLLLRHVDSAEDAARLARVSDAAGPRTRAVMETLGKRRAFRALVRVSNLAITAAAALYLAVLALFTQIAMWLGTRLWRGIVRSIA